jgi:hypothetical protein
MVVLSAWQLTDLTCMIEPCLCWTTTSSATQQHSSRFFKQTEFMSFHRQLNSWGFMRITKGKMTLGHTIIHFSLGVVQALQWSRGASKSRNQIQASCWSRYCAASSLPTPLLVEARHLNLSSNKSGYNGIAHSMVVRTWISLSRGFTHSTMIPITFSLYGFGVMETWMTALLVSSVSFVNHNS